MLVSSGIGGFFSGMKRLGKTLGASIKSALHVQSPDEREQSRTETEPSHAVDESKVRIFFSSPPFFLRIPLRRHIF